MNEREKIIHPIMEDIFSHTGGNRMISDSKYFRRYSLGEEVGNAVSHGIGAVLSFAALCLMVNASAIQRNGMKLTASLIYGSTLLLLYLMSTLYHAITVPSIKRVLQVLDHCSIFLLIAGTYTPFTMLCLPGKRGWLLFAFIWVTALIGIVLNAISIEKFQRFSMACYLLMGWAVVTSIVPLTQALSLQGLSLLVSGGIFYTAGTFFYSRKIPYFHFIWHLFVLAGSICHFLAVYFYVIL